jgi:MoxR-like ATPase
VLVGYPTPTEEFVIVQRMTGHIEPTQSVLDPVQLAALQRQADAVFVDSSLIEYAVKVVNATRDAAAIGLHDVAAYVTYGASPRASINMILAAKALAFVRGRDYALPADVRDLALDVLRHRVVLSYEALADDVTPDAVLTRILSAIALPDVPLRERAARCDDAIYRPGHS